MRGISMRKLAGMAGVSAMTVSRALRGAEGVGEEVRERILKLAREAGYPIPMTAQRPMSKLWGVMCVLGVSGEDGGDQFHSRIFEGMKAGAKECGSEVLKYSGPDTLWPLVVARRQVDGVVIVRGNERTPHPPFPSPVPCVFIFTGPEDADIVTVDHFASCRALDLAPARPSALPLPK